MAGGSKSGIQRPGSQKELQIEEIVFDIVSRGFGIAWLLYYR